MTVHDDTHNSWKTDIAPFQKSDIRKSLWQLTNSVIPFLGLWYLAYLSFSVSIWITLALTIPATIFFVRIFIIFHDCTHHSFFQSRRANDIVGMITGVLTFFPYHQWRHEHAVHHATSSNLDRRGTGDIWTLTVSEYLALSPFRRRVYRTYRNPFVMFGIGPIHLLLVEYRYNRKGARRKERWNTYLTNLSLAVILGLLCWLLGWEKVLIIEGSILYLAGMVGIWLFYVQHQFEGTYFEHKDTWEFLSAALQGSSLYRLPKVLQWMTGNIGFHHIHHLGPRVPNYNLERAHKLSPALQNIPEVGLMASLAALRFRVWDEEKKKFIGFKDISVLKRAKPTN